MQTPVFPTDENERLAALRQLELLDTPPEERFDRITRLACRLFNVPSSFVTLIDSDRQWFKSTCGFRANQTARDVSFCGHAILQEEALIVPDARIDPRFVGNPAVLGEPHIVFYVGQPLRGPGGRNVGSLCIIDKQPRAFTAEDRLSLADLGALVERELNLEEAYTGQQRRLRRANEAAQQANRAKSAFLANMSHELRTPLNAIIGYSEMLIEDVDDTLAPDLKTILTSGEKLLGMLDRLLDLSRLEANKLTVAAEDFSVAEIVAELTDAAQPLAAHNGNTFCVDCQYRDFVRGDAVKVRQALFNLLDNACKFTRQGTVTLRVAKGDPLASENEFPLIFEVADTGIGIDPEQVDSLFEKFKQGDESAARRFGGAGLGLAVSHKLCDLMGGTITARSAPGQGSVFTVRVPVRAVF
jgi:signal transduction histidine kinase